MKSLQFLTLLVLVSASFALEDNEADLVDHLDNLDREFKEMMPSDAASNRLFFGWLRCFIPNFCADGETCRFGLCFNRAAGQRCFFNSQCTNGTCNRQPFRAGTCN